MNRTLKEVTVNTYHDATHQQLKQHLYNFLNAYQLRQATESLTGIFALCIYYKNLAKGARSFLD